MPYSCHAPIKWNGMEYHLQLYSCGEATSTKRAEYLILLFRVQGERDRPRRHGKAHERNL
jgi:hypothetical protein